MDHADVLVIGGGAAGLMCAISAARRGRSVTVLEGSNKVGKKILMSGGGRCNFTNLHTTAENFISSNPHFCKSALSRLTQWDFIELVEKHAIPYHEKTLGQLFCDRSSKDIVAMLLAECDATGVKVLTHCEDARVAEGFTVACSQGSFTGDSLVIATGGLSIPKMGASDFGYRVARQFGHTVHETRAGLVPFTFTGELHESFAHLTGVSCAAAVEAGGVTFSEDILFTHRGLSGPAALQASSYWTPGRSISIDFAPATDLASRFVAAKAAQPASLIRTVLSETLPRALVLELQSALWPDHADTPLAALRDSVLRNIAGSIHAWCIKPAATEGYRTAEVTLGGVSTDELSSQSMESRRIPGLFFVGEVVDVTGHLGGHNFQWAWSSGHAAGQFA